MGEASAALKVPCVTGKPWGRVVSHVLGAARVYQDELCLTQPCPDGVGGEDEGSCGGLGDPSVDPVRQPWVPRGDVESRRGSRCQRERVERV